MSIFNFTDEQSLGEVRSVETSRITVRVTDGQRLQKARVGRLVAIQLMGDEWLIGIIERVWRHPVELPTLPEADPSADLAAVPQEENGVSISLVGTYRARDGQRKDTFTRAVFILPEINRPVFPIEEKSLEDFMGILSASSKADAAAPLKVGTYTLDGKASAYIDGDKLFQRHAALLGSTGSGKSFTVASILEQSAQLPHANIVVFDLHGEYSSMKFASHYRIAGIGDLKAKKDGAIFLPFWLLNYDEMQSLFVDRSEESAPNQASELMKQVVELKKKSIEGLGKHDLLDGFTVDTPVPYRLADLIEAIAEKDKEMVQGSKGEKQCQNERPSLCLHVSSSSRIRDLRGAAPASRKAARHRHPARWHQPRHQDCRFFGGALGHPTGRRWSGCANRLPNPVLELTRDGW